MSDLYKVFDDSQQRKTEMYAALDIGSNSFHLVVARVVADAVQIVSRVKQKVRLAQGLDKNNVLSQEAIERGVQTLELMQESLQGVDVGSMRIVATHTLRRAKNSREFLRRAREVFPYPIEIISGNEEARLIFVGIGAYSSFAGERLVFDIGGGSTEFAIGSGTEAIICKSIQMGCVSFQQRYFENGKINKSRTNKAITAAKLELELAAAKLSKYKWKQTVASSGTARAACAIINNAKGLAVDSPVNGSDLKQLLKQCIAAEHADNLDFEGLTEDRSSVFVAGLCILIAIYDLLKIDEIIFSDAALREGVLHELQPTHNTQSVRVRTAQSLATRYDVDTAYAHKVLKTCMYIFERVKDTWELNSSQLRHLLGWAALLHELGLQINSRGIQKHSSYVLLNTEMPGFNQEQQMIIANLVRFHRKKIRLDEIVNESSLDKLHFGYLLTILRLSVLLNINRHQPELPEFTVEANKNTIKLGFAKEWFELSPLLVADIDKESAYLQAIDVSLGIA